MQTKILSLQQKDNLAVVQFSSAPSNTIEYLSMENAMKAGFIEVTESSQGGTVNQICVINKSNSFIFLMDGDIIAGAKQNRVMNTSVFLAPMSKIMLPVSCVESGRWRYKSAKFTPTDYVAPSEMRKSKSRKVTENLKKFKLFDADQGEVWDNVAEYSRLLDVHSDSMSFSDVYEQRQSAYEKFLQSLSSEKEANGLAFFINRELKTVDVFNRTDIFREYFPKIIKGVALDVFNTQVIEQITEEEASSKTLDLLGHLKTVEPELYNGVGVGQEKRYNDKEVAGFELNYNDDMIHLSLHNLVGLK